MTDEEIIKDIEDRTPEGWYGLSVGKGWYPLVFAAHNKIKELDPDYKIYQIKEKFGCYDSDTELLTKEGWKFFKDVKLEELVATLNPLTNELEYQQTTDIIAYPYSGKMYRLVSRGVDLLVTPNHMLYTAKASYYNGKDRKGLGTIRVDHPYSLQPIANLFGKRKRFAKAAVWNGIEQKYFVLPEYQSIRVGKKFTRIYRRPEYRYKMDSFLQLLGWYIAEGSGDKDITFSLNNTDGGKEIAHVLSILSSLGLKSSVNNLKIDSCKNIRVYNIHLGRWLVNNCGHLAPNKKVPAFVFDLSSRQIRLFLEALFEGDGHQAKTALILTTTSSMLASQVQELILKVGDTSRIYESRLIQSQIPNKWNIYTKHPRYEINWLKLKDFNTPSPTPENEYWTDYDGNVYCVTVPNSIIYVRRNGIPVWCGNSLRYYCSNDGSPEFRAAIDEAEALSWKTCEDCGTTENVTTAGVDPDIVYSWIRTLCASCRNKDPIIIMEEE